MFRRSHTISYWRVFLAKIGGQPENLNAEKYNEEFALKLGNDLIAWLTIKDSIGTVKNIFYEDFLLIERGDLTEDIISYLAKKFDSFSGLIKKAKKIQEIKILKYAGRKVLNSSVGIFCLKANHGYTEKVEYTQKNQVELVDDGEPIKYLPPDKLMELEKTYEEQLRIMKGYRVDIKHIKKPDEKKVPIKNAVSNRKPNKKRSKKSTATARKKKAS